MRKLHNRKQIAGWMLCLLMLAGCGAAKIPDNVTKPSLLINNDGSVNSYIIGVFDRDYYDIDGLTKMAQEEVAAYNTANQTGQHAPVALDSVERLESDNNLVLVSSSYDSAVTYQDYTGKQLFYGTVEEARKAGYKFKELNQVLYDTKGKKSIVSGKLDDADMARRHVVVLAERTCVYCPYKVAYISEGAETAEDGSIGTANVLPEEYPVIIVLEK